VGHIPQMLNKSTINKIQRRAPRVVFQYYANEASFIWILTVIQAKPTNLKESHQ